MYVVLAHFFLFLFNVKVLTLLKINVLFSFKLNYLFFFCTLMYYKYNLLTGVNMVDGTSDLKDLINQNVYSL